MIALGKSPLNSPSSLLNPSASMISSQSICRREKCCSIRFCRSEAWQCSMRHGVSVRRSWLFRWVWQSPAAPPSFVWHAPRQRRVLYVDGEMPLVSLQERLRAISTGLGAVIPNDGFRRSSRRASEVFDSILALFRQDDQERQAINVNAIALEVLRSSRGELAEHRVTTRTELTSKLPLIPGHKGQLQQVISNLVQNAIEAMDNTADRVGCCR